MEVVRGKLDWRRRRRSRSDSNLEQMRESCPDWTTAFKSLKGSPPVPRGTITDTTAGKRGTNRLEKCSRCGIPIATTPPSASKAGVETKGARAGGGPKRIAKAGQRREPSSVDCFVVSRGRQLNEAALARALGRAFGSEGARIRVHVVSTMSAVAEQASPDAEATIIHVCGHELIDASYSASADGSNAPAVSGSVASVTLKQLARLASATRDRATLVLVSLPLPGAFDCAAPTSDDRFFVGEKFEILRKAFCAKLEAGCSAFNNVRLCDVGSAIYKSRNSAIYVSEAGQLTSAGIRKMVKVWRKGIVLI